MLSLITKSANDAAVVIAEALGGNEKAFALAMTKKARSLGMRHTTFKNASGAPDPGQRTTARDMAIMSKALIEKYKKYYPLFKIESFTYKGISYSNHNKLLGKVEGIDGIKTGLTNASGFNLAASCIRDGKRLIAVVMGGKTRHARDNLMTELIEAAYQGDNAKASLRYAKAENKAYETTPAVYQESNQEWMIQVGSHRTSRLAKENATKHLLILGSSYDVYIKIAKAPEKKRLNYRAYLAGFTPQQAKEACKVLKAKKHPCVVTPPYRSPKIYMAMN
jgi:D-alanyl-D-alanine carboxypeptidase